MNTKAPPVPRLFTHKTPRGTPSAAGLKRQINAAIDAKSSKPKKSYWQILSEISASHPDDQRPPTDLGILPQDELWLEENAQREGVVVLPNGLQYEQISTATPIGIRSPCASATCQCNYRGMLTDGTEFDSSEKYGGPVNLQPLKMIEGWSVAMMLMAEGDHWRLFIPPHLAYGDAGRSDQARGQYISSGAVLVFDLHISSIVNGPTKSKPVRPSAPPACGASFVPSAHFCGTRAGYIFKSSELGIGYYRDPKSLGFRNEPDMLLSATERGLAQSADPAKSRGSGAGGAADRSLMPLKLISASAGNLFERAPSPRPGASKTLVPPLTILAQRDAFAFSGNKSSRTVPTEVLTERAQEISSEFSDDPRDITFEKRLEEERRKERASLEEDALETVNAMLANLKLPTLQQALEDLGLPATGEKPALTARLTDSLTSGIVSGRRA